MLKKLIAISLLCAASQISFSQDDLVGEYKGTIEGKKGYPFDNNKEMCAQISKHANGYKLRILPELFKRSDDVAFASALKAKDGKIGIKDLGYWKLNGEIKNGEINLSGREGKNDFTIKLKKFERVSPTLGEKAPQNAKILFDGKNTAAWKTAKGQDCVWKLTEDGAMEVARDPKDPPKNQTIFSSEAFSNFKLHLEFMLPDMHKQSGQFRANSGVFIGPYEVQILDSFNCEGLWNECGAIYRIYPPISNAVLPPQKWQTYDIIFEAPKFEDGKLLSLPKITVYLNGILVQNKMEIPHGTSLPQPKRASYKHPKPPYKISLQDHGNPIKFRNIWVEEM